MAPEPPQEDSEVTIPQKRIRWATHRAKGPKADKKRQSLIDRLHHKRTASDEKKRHSAGDEGTITENGDVSSSASEEQDGGRRVYFNIPLPADERDEEGVPLARYARNKIRTARYTPLSFIPKNLWFQFHNVANIYFLFIIILGVRFPLSSCSLWY